MGISCHSFCSLSCLASSPRRQQTILGRSCRNLYLIHQFWVLFLQLSHLHPSVINLANCISEDPSTPFLPHSPCRLFPLIVASLLQVQDSLIVRPLVFRLRPPQPFNNAASLRVLFNYRYSSSRYSSSSQPDKPRIGRHVWRRKDPCVWRCVPRGRLASSPDSQPQRREVPACQLGHSPGPLCHVGHLLRARCAWIYDRNALG